MPNPRASVRVAGASQTEVQGRFPCAGPLPWRSFPRNATAHGFPCPYGSRSARQHRARDRHAGRGVRTRHRSWYPYRYVRCKKFMGRTIHLPVRRLPQSGSRCGSRQTREDHRAKAHTAPPRAYDCGRAAFELLARPQPRGPLSRSAAGRCRHGCRGRDFGIPTASNPGPLFCLEGTLLLWCYMTATEA